MNYKTILIGIVAIFLLVSISAAHPRIDTGPTTITKEVKDWLAVKAGSNNCFASSGIWYSDLEGNWRIGSTGSVMSMFYVGHLVGKEDTPVTWGYSYNSLKSLNNNVDFTVNDVKWVLQNQYCKTIR